MNDRKTSQGITWSWQCDHNLTTEAARVGELEAALTLAESAFEKLRDENTRRQSWQAWHAIGALRGWCESERSRGATEKLRDDDEQAAKGTRL